MAADAALVALYLSAAAGANLAVAAFGPGAAVPVAFVFVGLDLSTRDALHRRWGHGRRLWVRMALLIAAGGLVSWAVNRDAGRIAAASTVAFVAAGAADTLAYRLLAGRRWWVQLNGSNVVAAAVDSALFLPLAFGVILPGPMAGQLVAKVAGGALWGWLLFRRPPAESSWPGLREHDPEPWELEYQLRPDPEAEL